MTDFCSLCQKLGCSQQIFTPVFYFENFWYGYNPFLLTCKLTPSEQPKTLQLMLGVQDYAVDYDHEITFNVYLDGQQTASHYLSAGQGKTILLDVTKTSSVALEAICSLGSSGNYCPDLSFLKASVLPSPTSSLNNFNSATSGNSENSVSSNNPKKTANPPLEESSWGNSTVGSEEETESTNNNSSAGSNSDPLETINDTADTVDNIINIFK